MVNVKVHLQAARDILAMLTAAKTGQEVTQLDAIVNSPEYDFILRRHEFIANNRMGKDLVYSKEELKSVLSAAIRGEAYTSPTNKYFDGLSTILLKAADDLPALKDRIEALENIDWQGVQDALKAVLPDPNIAMNVSVFIAPDAHLSAYVHEGSIGVSLMPITVSDGNPILKVELPTEFTNTPEPVVMIFPIDDMLAHEMHHLVVAQAASGEEKESALHQLASGIQGEGMATWFFSMPPENTSMARYWQLTEGRIDEHFQTFVEQLGHLIGTPEESMQKAFQTLFSPPPGGGTEICYVVGANICRAIELAFGRDTLVSLTTNCPGFYHTYNQAAEKLNCSSEQTWPGPSAKWPLLPLDILKALAD